jgi:hypothetical protein
LSAAKSTVATMTATSAAMAKRMTTTERTADRADYSGLRRHVIHAPTTERSANPTRSMCLTL